MKGCVIPLLRIPASQRTVSIGRGDAFALRVKRDHRGPDNPQKPANCQQICVDKYEGTVTF